MREVFAAILDNAMVAGIMILVIVLIRVSMRKMPKFICPLLWRTALGGRKNELERIMDDTFWNL